MELRAFPTRSVENMCRCALHLVYFSAHMVFWAFTSTLLKTQCQVLFSHALETDPRLSSSPLPHPEPAAAASWDHAPGAWKVSILEKSVKRFEKHWHKQEHTQRMYKKHSNLFAILEFNYFSMWFFFFLLFSLPLSIAIFLRKVAQILFRTCT